MPLAAVPTLDAIAERPERGAELPRRVAVDLYFRALTVLQALAPALSVNPLFARSAAMRALRAYLECVVVAQDGVRIGVHRPGTTPQPSVCGA